MLNLDKRTDDLVELLANIPRETICTVGGEAVTIPVEVPPAVALAYTRTRMKQGSDVATVWAMELLMTSDGMSLFLTADLKEDKDLDAVVAIILQRVSGASTGTADAAPKASPIAAKTSPRPRRTTAARSRAAKS